MDRVKVPSQSKQSLEKVFENLQDYIKTNIDTRISTLFNNFGIKSLVNGTDLAVSLTSGTAFNVNAGVGMTNDYEIIKLSNITGLDLQNAINSLTKNPEVLATGTFYVVKLFWQLSGSDPVPVANGFNYNAETTNPEDQRYSKYVDSFVLSTETITEGNMPTAQSNEIMLAIVKTDAATTNLTTGWTSFDAGTDIISEVNGVADIRYLNFLSQSDIKITDGNTLETSSITPSGTGLTVKSDDDLPIEYKTAADASLMKIDNINRKVEITTADDVTTALSVTGKVDVSGEIYSEGWKVLTEEIYEMKHMINFHVVNISSTLNMEGTNYIDPSISSADLSYYRTTLDHLRLNLEWGYNQITGIGGTGGSFVVTSGETWATDELAGYHIWIPGSPGTNYYIASNTSTVLTLNSGFGTVADTSGISVTGSPYARINHNATRYEVAAIPYTSGGSLDDGGVEGDNVTYGESPVNQKLDLILKAGVKFNVKVRGIRGDGIIGPWTPLLWDSSHPNGAAGSFTYMGVTYNYGPNGDILMKHVTLTDTAATFAATATPSGFKAVLTPGNGSYNWSEAEEYEFAWSDIGTTINWADPTTYESRITPLYNVSIATYDSIEYNLSVRPLIGHMSVGTPLNTTVISGTGGALPANNIIATVPVELYTFSATDFTSVDLLNKFITFDTNTNLYSPSQSTDVASYSSLKPGYIVSVEGYDYILIKKVDTNTWYYDQVNHHSNNPPSGGVPFTINTSKDARKVYSSVLQADTQITKLEAVSTIQDGEDVTVRVYQNAGSRENFADHVVITNGGSGQTFATAGDMLVLQSYGNRELVIDLFDDDAPPNDLNDGTFVGTINVYGQTYTNSAYDQAQSTT